MTFTPRLVQILFLLLNSSVPIPANTLGTKLKISRRTIFRELENINKLLYKYNLTLDTISNKGLWLSGKLEDKNILLEELKKTDYFDPRNKEVRYKKLIFEVLRQDEPRKLYYYADLLQVSEATISNDMEVIEKWFLKYNINLIRKPGLGIYIEGNEKDYRTALKQYILKNYEILSINNIDSIDQTLFKLIDKNILIKVISILEEIDIDKLNRMTQYSYNSLILFLSIMVKRITLLKSLEINSNEKTEENESSIFLRNIVSKLEFEFNIKINSEEVLNLSIHLKGLKFQYVYKDDNLDNITKYGEDIFSIIYEMINAYDSLLAYDLKQDEEFIDSLIAHLNPTISRLKYKMEIQNPFLKEIQREYSDIYNKTKIASKVISTKFGCDVPEDEIGFLALHFGAATLRIKNKKNNLRKINVGVACLSGIGISKLLSSRLIHIFQEKINVIVLSHNDLVRNSLKSIDFIVSTYELENVTVPNVIVNPILLEDDINKISELIKLSNNLNNSLNDDLLENVDIISKLDNVNFITKDINSIIDSFNIYYIRNDITFEEVMKFASDTLHDSELSHEIYNDLKKREALSTQVIPEYNLALLHAKTNGIKLSKFIVILPKGTNSFVNEYLNNVEVIVVMLIPKNNDIDEFPMSYISSGLFENQNFLNSLKNGDKDKINSYIQSYLKQFLVSYFRNINEN